MSAAHGGAGLPSGLLDSAVPRGELGEGDVDDALPRLRDLPLGDQFFGGPAPEGGDPLPDDLCHLCRGDRCPWGQPEQVEHATECTAIGEPDQGLRHRQPHVTVRGGSRAGHAETAVHLVQPPGEVLPEVLRDGEVAPELLLVRRIDPEDLLKVRVVVRGRDVLPRRTRFVHLLCREDRGGQQRSDRRREGTFLQLSGALTAPRVDSPSDDGVVHPVEEVLPGFRILEDRPHHVQEFPAAPPLVKTEP